MTRRFRSYFFVGWILRMATRVTRNQGKDTGKLVKRLNHAPETPARKRRQLRLSTCMSQGCPPFILSVSLY